MGKWLQSGRHRRPSGVEDASAQCLHGADARVSVLEVYYFQEMLADSGEFEVELSKEQQAVLARIAADLARTGLALPGSLSEGYYRCGRATCRCVADPPQLHGPYAMWTRKANNRTVTRRLAEPELSDYRPLFDNAKRLRALIAELQELTLSVVGTPPTSGAKCRPAAGTKVDSSHPPTQSW